MRSFLPLQAVLRRSSFIIFLGISLFANAQDLYHITGIRITGNERTKESVIHREMTIRTGENYTVEMLDSLSRLNTRLLFNLHIFNGVEVYFDTTVRDSTTAYVYLKERWFGFIAPIVELGDRNFTEFTLHPELDRLNYGVRVSLNNLFGVRQSFKTALQLGFTKKVSFDYNVPYLNKKKTIGTRINYTYKTNYEIWYSTVNNKIQRYTEDNDQVFTRNYGELAFYFRPKYFSVYETGLRFEKSRIADSVAIKYDPEFFGKGKSTLQHTNLFLNYIIDRRNQQYYATNGFYFMAALDYNMVNTDLSWPELSVRINKYRQLSPKVYLAQNTVGKLVLTDQSLPYFFYKALGYDHNLRGFELYVIDGRNFAIAQQHIAYRIIPQKNYRLPFRFYDKFSTIPFLAYLRLFADAGYVYDNQFSDVNSFRNKIIYSCGVGLDMVTYYDKVFRVDVSYLSNGLFGAYFSLKNNF